MLSESELGKRDVGYTTVPAPDFDDLLSNPSPILEHCYTSVRVQKILRHFHHQVPTVRELLRSPRNEEAISTASASPPQSE